MDERYEDSNLTKIGISLDQSNISTEPILLLFHAMYVHMMNMKLCHWGVRGSNFDSKHDLFEKYEEVATEHLDEIAEMAMIIYEHPMNPAELPDSQLHMYSARNRDWDNMDRIRNSTMYLIELFDHTIEKMAIPAMVSKLEEMRYYWYKECQYKMRRRLLSK